MPGMTLFMMGKLISRLIAVTFGSLSLASCTLNVPQLNTLKTALQTYPANDETKSSSDASSGVSQPTWRAEFGDSVVFLKPYTYGDLWVFANQNGDAVSFDGWHIRSLLGFGLPATLGISHELDRRSYFAREKVSKVQCDPFMSVAANTQIKRYFQSCDNYHFTSIDLNIGGEIEAIEQTVTMSGSVIRLERIK